MKGLADILGSDSAPEEETESTAELDAAIDELEASSDIKVSDRQAFADAIAALVECCGGYSSEPDEDDDEPKSKGKHSLTILLGVPKK